jgi:hypothetical protein
MKDEVSFSTSSNIFQELLFMLVKQIKTENRALRWLISFIRREGDPPFLLIKTQKQFFVIAV